MSMSGEAVAEATAACLRAMSDLSMGERGAVLYTVQVFCMEAALRGYREVAEAEP